MLIKLLLGLLIACYGAPTDQTRDLLSLVHKTFANTGEAVIPITADNFKQFVMDKPKHYNLIMLYTANMQICRICKPFQDAFERVAMSYIAVGALGASEDEQPTVFGIVDIGLQNDIGRIHNLNTLPHIVRLNGDVSDVTQLPTGILNMPPRKFGIVKLDVTAQEILDWVNREVGKEVPLYYTQTEKLFRLVAILAVVVGVVILAFKLIMLCRQKPSVIAFVALFIYYISTSGIFYNLLHGMQWVGVGPDGLVQFLFQGARGQYLGEGLMMSGLTVISGVCLFLAARLPYTDFAKKADANDLAIRLVFLIAISAVCLYAVVGAYVVKLGWYSDASLSPPAHYRKGPLRVDQGNTY